MDHPAPTPSAGPALRAGAAFPLIAGGVAAIVALGFAAYTGHIWEDYFITFRSSWNLANGHGLVYQPGERVHSFTSPLGVLLPASFAWAGGDEVAALWGLRVVSALALAAAVGLAVRQFRRDELVAWAGGGIALAWALDPKLVDFAINGMETALMVAGVVATWHAFVSGARLWPCALGCAWLQWTRPDGWVFFAAIAVAWVLLGAHGSWRTRAAVALRAAGAAVVLYLPWLGYAWVYYGSPIPHTILAKLPTHPPLELAGRLASFPWRLVFGHVRLHEIFLPTAFYMEGWPRALGSYSWILGVGGALAWLSPRVGKPGRIGSAAFFVGGFYLEYVPGFPWYFPAWQVLGLLAWAYVLDAAWRSRPAMPWFRAWPQAAVRVGAAVLVLLQAATLAGSAWQMRWQQALVENGHRREIGRWLAQHASEGDRVFLECLGYIGYYSRLKMLDCPGLAAPEVVARRRAGDTTFARIIRALDPDWLVLRPGEALGVYEEIPELRERYRFARLFDVRASIDAIRILPGRGYLEYDAVFVVYRREARAGANTRQ